MSFLQPRYIQQQQPSSADQDSLTPFTHPVGDYYTNPLGTDTDDGSGDKNDELFIHQQQPQASVITTLWVSVCISILLLVTFYIIILRATRRNRQKRIQQQQSEGENFASKMPVHGIISISIIDQRTHNSSWTNAKKDIEMGQLHTVVTENKINENHHNDDKDGDIGVVGISKNIDATIDNHDQSIPNTEMDTITSVSTSDTSRTITVPIDTPPSSSLSPFSMS